MSEHHSDFFISMWANTHAFIQHISIIYSSNLLSDEGDYGFQTYAMLTISQSISNATAPLRWKKNQAYSHNRNIRYVQEMHKDQHQDNKGQTCLTESPRASICNG